MNGLYNLLFICFVVGACVGFINGLGIFPDNNLPNPGYKLDTSTVTELQSTGTSQTANDFSIWQLIQSFMLALGTGIVALVAVGYPIYAFMIMIGSDPTFAVAASGLIQACVTFVTVWGLYELWTGRSVT